MPRYVEPKSESAFRKATTGPKPYLLSDGLGDAALEFTRRLMAIFGRVVDPSPGIDEDVLDVDPTGDLSLCRQIAAQVGQSRSCATLRDRRQAPV